MFLIDLAHELEPKNIGIWPGGWTRRNIDFKPQGIYFLGKYDELPQSVPMGEAHEHEFWVFSSLEMLQLKQKK